MKKETKKEVLKIRESLVNASKGNRGERQNFKAKRALEKIDQLLKGLE